MMIICSVFLLVNYLTIVTSYMTASKLLTGLPQTDKDLISIDLLALLELIILGFFLVFIRTSILVHPGFYYQYNLTSLDKMIINFIFIYGTIIRGLLLLIMCKLDMEYNRIAFGHVDYLEPVRKQTNVVTVS